MESLVVAEPPRRRPLQPRNLDPIPPVLWLQPKPKPVAFRSPSSTIRGAGKENRRITPPEVGPRDASLAEELAAIRLRRERLRVEREYTEKALRERDTVMQRWALELERWAEEQRNLELELRLLIKLQDLRSSSMMLSPVQSLREKEKQRSMEVQLQAPESAEQNSEVDNPSSTQEN